MNIGGISPFFLSQGYNPATLAYLDALDTQPTPAEVTKLDEFFNTLDDAALLDIIDGAWYLAAGANQPSRVNLMNPGVDTLVASGGTFTAGAGWQGNGSSYLATTRLMNAMPNFENYSAHISVWCKTHANQNASDCGHEADTGCTIRAYYSSYTIVGAVNCSGTAFGRGNSGGTAIGHTLVQRVSSTELEIYKNGVSALTGYVNGSGSSFQAPAASPFYVMNGFGIGSTKQIAFASCGGKLTADQALIYYNAVSALLA